MLAENPNRSALLAALHPEADRFDSVRKSGGEFDWKWILERATAHKIQALLASRIATSGTTLGIPDAIRERLSEATVQALARNAKALRDLERVDDCLRGAGISYILIKGPILTQQVYEGPEQRHFFDLDILVREAQVDATQAALVGIGYRLWGGDRYLGFAPTTAKDLERATCIMRRSLRRFTHELPLVTADSSLLPIDLHWRLMPRGRMKATADDVWEQATTASVGGINVRVLGSEATLLHLAMHAWSNRPWSFALLHLCDVAWALHYLRVDPVRLRMIARRWGAQEDLRRSMFAVERVLGVEAPPGLGIEVIGRPKSARFRRIATAATLVDDLARPAPPAGRARLQREGDWALAMGTLRSTALLLLGKYTALLRYRSGLG